MTPQMSVRVSYEALPGQGDFELVRADVERQLPLRNLHWVRKNGANRSIRTIQALPVDFRPLDYFGNQASLSLLARPYLHVLFVVCDDNDTYRATVRAQIREWLDSIISRQHQEWLIVHVTTGKSAGAKFYQRKGAVVDKIKADFNVGKKDRCIQVAQAASAEDPTAWAEFSSKVKEAVIASFDSNISLYEENVRKADSQRQLEGWQFLPFFSQKEALADSFEVMGLWEDALVQYDELEASFFQALKEHSMSWFGRFGGTSEGDDALALLSTTKKPYRQLITANNISVFDFRIYLFGRQATMLFRLGRTAEIARRGAYFISTFARTLRQHQATLGENFCESWTYSACLNIVDECQRANERKAPDRDTSAQFTAAKAELLELARKQLDKIGMSSGHLPFEHPFAMSLQEVSSVQSPNPDAAGRDRPPVSRKDLLDAISNSEIFHKLYVDLTNRAIRAFTTSGRKRCSLKLHCSLAALELHRDRQDSAQKLYSHLPAHYVDLRWIKIEAALLNQCTRLQATLDLPRERLLSTLALIRAGIEVGTSRWNLDAVCEPSLKRSQEDDMSLLAQRLMADVYTLSSKLAKDFAAIAFPTFSMKLASDIGAIAESEDGVNVILSVQNLLPCALQVDEVRLKFATPRGESIWFTAPACTLNSGQTDVVLFCPTAITSRLALELSQIRFSRIIFQYSHRPVSPRNLAPDPRNASSLSKQPTVRFPHDHQALEAFIETPDTIDLSDHRAIIVCIAAGRNQVLKAQLLISTQHPDILGLEQGRPVSEGAPLTIKDGALFLENLAAQSETRIIVPIVGKSVGTTLTVTLTVEFHTVKRPHMKRSFHRDETISLALPLAVNVQDFFRKDCVLSKFTVATDGVQALSIQSAHLLSAGRFDSEACGRDQGVLSIMPLQVSNFLFRVTACADKAAQKSALRFELIYSTTEDQLKARIAAAVDAAVRKDGLQSDSRWFEQALFSSFRVSPHLVEAKLAAQIRETRIDVEPWSREVAMRFEGRSKQALSALENILQSLASTSEDIPASAWRKLSIPVDIPALDILNLVSVTTDCKRMEVGQSVPVTLSIRPVFAWTNRSKASLQSMNLEYDVVVKGDDWVSSGRKRGEFVPKEDSEFTICLVLIPLRPGALFLPSVAIRPVAPASDAFSCETQHLNAALTVEVLPGPAATQSVFLLESQGIYVA